MTAYDALLRAQESAIREENLQERVSRLRVALEYNSPKLSILPRGKGPGNDRLATQTAQLIDLENRYIQMIVENEEERWTLEKIMQECLTDREYSVIVMRYFRRWGWRKIGAMMHYNHDYVRQSIAGAAIQKLKDTRISS